MSLGTAHGRYPQQSHGQDRILPAQQKPGANYSVEMEKVEKSGVLDELAFARRRDRKVVTRATASNKPVRLNPRITTPGPARVRCRDPEAGALEVCPRSSICLPEELDISGRLGLLVPKMKTTDLGFNTANRGHSRCRKCKDKERQIRL